MPQIKFRIYVDTSVIGDWYFRRRVFRGIESFISSSEGQKNTHFVVSDVVLRELYQANKEVPDVYESIPDESIKILFEENGETFKNSEKYKSKSCDR